MKLTDMLIGEKYVVTNGSRGTLNKGDHVEMFIDPWGELCIACKEAKGWLTRGDWKKLNRVEIATDVETLEEQFQDALKHVAILKKQLEDGKKNANYINSPIRVTESEDCVSVRVVGSWSQNGWRKSSATDCMEKVENCGTCIWFGTSANGTGCIRNGGQRIASEKCNDWMDR